VNAAVAAKLLRSASTQRRVYFASNLELTRIKIGKSIEPSKRLTDLQSGSPDLLILVGEVIGYTYVEHWFHRLFAHARIHSEWFVVDDEIARMVYRVQQLGLDASQTICPEAFARDLPSSQQPTWQVPLEIVNEARGRFEHGESLESIFGRFPNVQQRALSQAIVGITHKHDVPLINRPVRELVHLLRPFRPRRSRC